jgi:hypothetical protein
MKYSNEECIDVLNKLIFKAFENFFLGCICTLLRVYGAADKEWDPFEESRESFDDFNWLLLKSNVHRTEKCSRRMQLLMYCHAIEMTAPQEILANLFRCLDGLEYVINPFGHLIKKKKNSFEYIPPSAKQKFKEINNLGNKVNENDLLNIINSFYSDKVRNAFSHSDYILTSEGFRFTEGQLPTEIQYEELDILIDNCFTFYSSFFASHKLWLKELAKMKKFYKCPQYEVLELLANNKSGLYGFKIHFSNGSNASFIRDSSGIKPINISQENDGTINYFVGDLNKLENKWKVNGKIIDDWDNLP